MDHQHRSIGNPNYIPSHHHSSNWIQKQWKDHLLKHTQHGDSGQQNRLPDSVHMEKMMQCCQHTIVQCLWCQAEVEDKIHIIHCLVPIAWTQWMLSLLSLKRWLKAQGLDSQLCKQLIALLNNWANATESHDLPNIEYCAEQTRIRWDRMMDGWVSCKWRDHQEHIWKNIRSWKSSLQWMAVLIQKMWDVPWDMWNHQNKELHNGDIARQLILHLAVDTQIAILYEGRGAQQLPWDALKFLTTPKETVLLYSLVSKQLWLELVKAAQQHKKTQIWKISEQTMIDGRMAKNSYAMQHPPTISIWLRVGVLMDQSTYYRLSGSQPGIQQPR